MFFVGVLEVEFVDFVFVWFEWVVLGECFIVSYVFVWMDICLKSMKFVLELLFFWVCNFIDGN